MKRKNKLLIIIAIAFIITALVFLIVGLTMAGNNILEWLTSKYAILFYIAFGTYAVFVVFLFIGDWIKKI